MEKNGQKINNSFKTYLKKQLMTHYQVSLNTLKQSKKISKKKIKIMNQNKYQITVKKETKKLQFILLPLEEMYKYLIIQQKKDVIQIYKIKMEIMLFSLLFLIITQIQLNIQQKNKKLIFTNPEEMINKHYILVVLMEIQKCVNIQYQKVLMQTKHLYTVNPSIGLVLLNNYLLQNVYQIMELMQMGIKNKFLPHQFQPQISETKNYLICQQKLTLMQISLLTNGPFYTMLLKEVTKNSLKFQQKKELIPNSNLKVQLLQNMLKLKINLVLLLTQEKQQKNLLVKLQKNKLKKPIKKKKKKKYKKNQVKKKKKYKNKKKKKIKNQPLKKKNQVTNTLQKKKLNKLQLFIKKLQIQMLKMLYITPIKPLVQLNKKNIKKLQILVKQQELQTLNGQKYSSEKDMLILNQKITVMLLLLIGKLQDWNLIINYINNYLIELQLQVKNKIKKDQLNKKNDLIKLIQFYKIFIVSIIIQLFQQNLFNLNFYNIKLYANIYKIIVNI